MNNRAYSLSFSSALERLEVCDHAHNELRDQHKATKERVTALVSAETLHLIPSIEEWKPDTLGTRRCRQAIVHIPAIGNQMARNRSLQIDEDLESSEPRFYVIRDGSQLTNWGSVLFKPTLEEAYEVLVKAIGGEIVSMLRDTTFSVPGSLSETTLTISVPMTQKHWDFVSMIIGGKGHCGDVLTHFSGYWLRGIEHDSKLGWLVYDQCGLGKDLSDVEIEILKEAWRKGDQLPEHVYRLDQQLALRTLSWGCSQWGHGFIDGITCDYGDCDVALQHALFGHLVYG